MPFAARHLCLDHPAPPGPGWTALGRFERIERPDAAYPLAPITDTPSPYEVDDLPEAPPPLTYRRIGSRGHAPARGALTGLLVVMVDNLDPGRAAEFNEWYDGVHVPDVMAAGSYVRATRYEAVSDGPARPAGYLAVYQTDWDSPLAAHRAVAQRAADMQMWPALEAIHVASYRRHRVAGTVLATGPA